MSPFFFIVAFFSAGIIAFVFTVAVRHFAIVAKVIDLPSSNARRKTHTVATPLLGGVAVFVGFATVVIAFVIFSDWFVGGYLSFKHVLGILIAGVVLMCGGFLDDKYTLRARYQILFPLVAVAMVIAAGIGVTVITNPFGGFVHLDTYALTIFTQNDTPYRIVVLADLFALFWLMGSMYTTKLLDGLDGLATGLGAIGGIIIFALSISATVGQPETALMALAFAGACVGFLFWNFHPAKIFLGEGGSLFIGFMLGVLAIISGAKVATALLVMGIPILDVLVVMLRRMLKGRSPFSTSDRKHLHFLLHDSGFTHRASVLLLYFFSAAFGVAGLFLTGKGKALTLAILVALTCALYALSFVKKRGKRTHAHVDN